MTRSLVTGGSGFIGRYLVSTLLARGDCVRVFDLHRAADLPPGVEFIQGSVVDRPAALRALDGIDCVYHLAAIAHLWTPDEEDYDRVNRVGTEAMLSAAREKGVARFVHCSTEAIMLPPRNGAEMVDESGSVDLNDMPGPYTRSKYLAEQAALSAAQTGLPVVVVNPTLPIGAGDDNFTPPTAMLALFLSKPPLVFLDCVLNLVDVRDVALGIVIAGERGRIGERYILGGENVSLRELAQSLQHVSGRSAPKVSLPGPVALAAGAACGWLAKYVTHRTPPATTEGVRLALRSAPLDSSKARRELGYTPRPASEPLARAVSWLYNALPSLPTRQDSVPATAFAWPLKHHN